MLLFFKQFKILLVHGKPDKLQMSVCGC